MMTAAAAPPSHSTMSVQSSVMRIPAADLEIPARTGRKDPALHNHVKRQIPSPPKQRDVSPVRQAAKRRHLFIRQQTAVINTIFAATGKPKHRTAIRLS
jgi:hypothetical protein